MSCFVLISNNVFTQVDDRAVIPMGVTLNSILRLNIVSGGNIEFNFNTIEQYRAGIPTSSQYETRFTVASSVDWDVEMVAEDAALQPTSYGDTASFSGNLSLDNIGYHLTANSGTDLAGGETHGIRLSDNNPAALSNTAALILESQGDNAGGVEKNDFTIHWQCGTQIGDMNGASILDQNVPAARYTTNVFLRLKPAD